MHKITKGLKKKKKGKKSKRNEDELFKPEELENYRKEHQCVNEESGPQNEEWKKFIALTHGVDDVLKKTQGDLDRIKSTSFFQIKPTESEVKRVEKQRAEEQKRIQVKKEEEEAAAQAIPAQLGIVEVSESESEEEEDDNIFDTAYVDVLASGKVKLAYIPESPTENQEGDDPFDTSIAERAILGPAVLRKGKKLVPLGAAVEVLTGRVQLPTCATKKSPNRRQVLKERDLLLGSFDDTANLGVVPSEVQPEEIKKTLLDEDSDLPIDVPIDLSKSIQIPQQTPAVRIVDDQSDKKDIINEFDVITKDDDEDVEFELLAAESLSKSSAKGPTLPVSTPVVSADIIPENCKWSAFETEVIKKDEVVINDDPFDTTFAENIFPDLKSENPQTLINGPCSNFESDINLFEADPRLPATELNFIKPADRDLLGGSNLDLTSITDTQFQNSTTDDIEDDDFDPRADETRRERTISRPDVLNISSVKTVSFDVPSPEDNLLGAETYKVIKPLTPFYSRKSGVLSSDSSEITDPFDTTFAVNLAPGKAELRVIESELLDPNTQSNVILEDNNFDPRDEQRAKIDKVVNTIRDISNPKITTITKSIDLLAIDNDIHVKVLTPGGSTEEDSGEILYRDPFDTSIACNILPGKTELKLLESELIYSDKKVQQDLDTTTIKNNRVDDLLLQKEDIVIEKPLSPSEHLAKSSVIEEEFNPDFDPFDTSSVSNIQPGKVELKLLESEFIQ